MATNNKESKTRKVQVQEPYKTTSKPKFDPWSDDENGCLSLLNSNHFYNRNQIMKFTRFSRFGYLDPYNTNSVSREYIFFSKMDLHLFTEDTQTLNPELANNSFFIHCRNRYTPVMNQLQLSSSKSKEDGLFCKLLTNTVSDKLDLQDIDIDKLETAQNIMGTKMEYPLATTTSSNVYSFNLEFQDTKFLDVYMFFRIWYEYELLKSNGLVTPPNQSYITNRVLHDQMSAYKIIVGEDMETIIYWAKFWGVYPTNIPRSSFSDLQEGPTKLAVGFSCQWVEDMDPLILSDFNELGKKERQQYTEDIKIYNSNNGLASGRWCHVPYIVESSLHDRKVYKLKWR